MSNFLIYLFSSSIIFICFYTTYKLLLSKYTFHNLNRIILLIIIPISLFISITKISIPAEIIQIEIPTYIEPAIASEHNTVAIEKVTDTSKFNYSIILFTIYIIGCVITFTKFTNSLYNLHKLKQKSKTEKKGKYILIYADVMSVFSCFNWIFIPKHMNYSIDNVIIEHEKKHVDSKHTLDLILAELYIIFYWFNPIVYFYRKSLKSIHEYQADSKVLNKKIITTSDYLKLLKTEIENSTKINNVYSYFKHPVIKQRVNMILKKKSNQLLKFKYIILIPVAFLFMVSFTIQVKPSSNKNIINSNKPPSISPIKNTKKTEITAKYGPTKHPILKSMRHHNGIDFRASTGTPIVATADGIIANASYENKWGNLIIIKHDDGYETLYAHLSKFNCKKKQTVKKGEIIGYSGSTGMVTGPHLHYSIKHNNEYVNPIDFIN